MERAEDKCYLCGEHNTFSNSDHSLSYREIICSNCGTSIRSSDLSRVIASTVANKQISLSEAIVAMMDYKVLVISSSLSLHDLLKQLPGYVYGEYYQGLIKGYEDDYFDLIVSEDALEHVHNVNTAFEEINRVLKQQGLHIFTVPFQQNRRTLDRSYLNNKIYHRDSSLLESAQVYTDFGEDIDEILNGFGMKTERFAFHHFRDGIENSNIDQKCKYNSVVFRSMKLKNLDNVSVRRYNQSDKIDFTGERYIPTELNGEMAAEHLQRYKAISHLVHNKVVVDAACGEGYGSFILSQYAKRVYGVDIDKASISAAKEKYRVDKVNYINASIQKLPFEDHSIDVVVSFETIEHVDEDIQNEFLIEVKRILKHDGTFIISTPDKMNYSDKYDFHNIFHIREFYFGEFEIFLKQYFDHVKLYNQGFETFCLISAERPNDNKIRFINQEESWKINKKYIVAVCSNKEIVEGDSVLSMYWQDGISYENHISTISKMHNTIMELKRQMYGQSKIIQKYMLEEINKKKKVVFFGTGTATKRILELAPIKVDYYIDNNQQKWGHLFENVPIYPPAQLLVEDKDQLAIIVASQFFEQISKQLTEMGYEEFLHYWNGYTIFLSHLD